MSRATKRDILFDKLARIDNLAELVRFCLDENLNACAEVCDKEDLEFMADTFIAEDGQEAYDAMIKVVEEVGFGHFKDNGPFVPVSWLDFFEYHRQALIEWLNWDTKTDPRMTGEQMRKWFAKHKVTQ